MKHVNVIFTIVILFSIGILTAHPASMLNASYNMEKELLTINFGHSVKDNADHFIESVVVMKNKKEIISQKLSYQDSMAGGSLFFKVNDLKPKDVIEIVSSCNKMGKKSYTMEIKAPEPVTTKPAPPSGK